MPGNVLVLQDREERVELDGIASKVLLVRFVGGLSHKVGGKLTRCLCSIVRESRAEA